MFHILVNLHTTKNRTVDEEYDSSIQWIRFAFSSTGALSSTLKKRPWEITRNLKCKASEFQADQMHCVWPESPGCIII